MILAASAVGSALAEPMASSPVLSERRSAVEDTCEPRTEVCGIMGPDRLVPFDDACAARAAGATRILVGPCFDDD